MNGNVDSKTDVSDVRDHARRLAIAATALGMTMGVAPGAVLAMSEQGQAASTEAQVKAPQKLATNYYKVEYDPKAKSEIKPTQLQGHTIDPKAISKIKPTQLPGNTIDPKAKLEPR